VTPIGQLRAQLRATKRWIHKDIARRRGVPEDVVRKIYAAVQIAKRQELHGGYTVDLIERSVGRILNIYEHSVAYLAREHLGYSCPPRGYGGPEPRGAAKEPPRVTDHEKLAAAGRLAARGAAIIRDVLNRRNKSIKARKPSFSVLLKKAAELLDDAANACAQAGSMIRTGTFRERAKYARHGDFRMLEIYNHPDFFQDDR